VSKANVTIIHTDHIIPASGSIAAQPMPDLLTRDEVIRVLRLDKLIASLPEKTARGQARKNTLDPNRTIANLVAKGTLKGTQAGHFALYTKESVLQCIKEQAK